jgi:hypothetical protein
MERARHGAYVRQSINASFFDLLSYSCTDDERDIAILGDRAAARPPACACVGHRGHRTHLRKMSTKSDQAQILFRCFNQSEP